MKYHLFFIVIILLLALSLPSCGESISEKETVTIVTTVFSEYDWVKNILGESHDGVEVILLTENGTDLHSFQPSVASIAQISSCDILIYTGGISDSWIESALSASVNPKQTVIKLMDLLTDAEKLTEQSHHHNTSHGHHSGENHSTSYDEHVWLSLRHAKRFCQAINQALCQKIPDHAAVYSENCAAYVEKLDSLDKKFGHSVSVAPDTYLLFADRFPFSYLTHDYGLTCYAAFPGCSAETEASFETVTFLAERLKTLSLPAVFILENSERELAYTIIATAEKEQTKVLCLHSLQSVSQADIKNGASYLSLMEQNLNALCLALNVVQGES